jgi:hypothetical protein
MSRCGSRSRYEGDLRTAGIGATPSLTRVSVKVPFSYPLRTFSSRVLRIAADSTVQPSSMAVAISTTNSMTGWGRSPDCCNGWRVRGVKGRHRRRVVGRRARRVDGDTVPDHLLASGCRPRAPSARPNAACSRRLAGADYRDCRGTLPAARHTRRRRSSYSDGRECRSSLTGRSRRPRWATLRPPFRPRSTFGTHSRVSRILKAHGDFWGCYFPRTRALNRRLFRLYRKSRCPTA